MSGPRGCAGSGWQSLTPTRTGWAGRDRSACLRWSFLGWSPTAWAGLALVAQDCPVRDAIGWLLAHPTNVKAYLVAGDGQQVYVDTAAVEASEWFAAGFGFGDYVYAAAGLTIDEARAGIDSGALDPQMAFTLAALRGVAIPVG